MYITFHISYIVYVIFEWYLSQKKYILKDKSYSRTYVFKQ